MNVTDGFDDPTAEDDVYDFDAIEHETERALLVRVGEAKHWLPKSQVRVVDDNGDVLRVAIPEWLAKEKGLC